MGYWLRFITTAVIVFGLPLAHVPASPVPISLAIAVAEEEDDEDEDHEEEEDEDEDDRASATEIITRTYQVIERVAQTVIVTPAEFLSDRDGDLLVDALDPDPDVHQREYFTDDDGDGLANVNDRFPGEDDFTYYESEWDRDEDGIVDSYEE